MKPEQVRTVLDGQQDYQNLLRFYNQEELSRKLAASKLSPVQFKALFEDSFGAFDLAAGGVEAAYSNKAQAATALRAVANLRPHANTLRNIANGGAITPAAKQAIKAYGDAVRAAPPAAKQSLQQLQRIILNSNVTLPAYSHFTPAQLQQMGGSGTKNKPQIKSLIGSAGDYNEDVATEVQDFTADYLHHQANQLAPQHANVASPEAEDEFVLDTETPDESVAADQEQPEMVIDEEAYPEEFFVAPQPRPTPTVSREHDEHHAVSLAVANSIFTHMMEEHMRHNTVPHTGVFLFQVMVVTAVNSSEQAVKAREAQQTALTANEIRRGFEQSIVAAMPVFLYAAARLTIFGTEQNHSATREQSYRSGIDVPQAWAEPAPVFGHSRSEDEVNSNLSNMMQMLRVH